MASAGPAGASATGLAGAAPPRLGLHWRLALRPLVSTERWHYLGCATPRHWQVLGILSAVDLWLPAPHDEGADGMLARLDAEADRLSGVAVVRSQPFELPLKPLLGGRVVGGGGLWTR